MLGEITSKENNTLNKFLRCRQKEFYKVRYTLVDNTVRTISFEEEEKKKRRNLFVKIMRESFNIQPGKTMVERRGNFVGFLERTTVPRNGVIYLASVLAMLSKIEEHFPETVT